MICKRMLAWVIALGIGITVLGGYARAAEYQPENVYVLNYTNQNIEGYEDYDAKRLYASDHYAGLRVDEDGDGVRESDWNWTCFSVLNMINTQKLSQPGEGAWASIPVYCADAVTDGVPGHQYRRVNLEDADFFSKEAAGRLRSIFFHSFPYIRDMEELEAAGNGWIKDSGKELGEIKHLRESEVISATQAAIWTLTNDVQVYEPYLGTGGYYRESEMVDTAIFRQEATEHTGDNIRSFYHYLLALEPTTAGNTVVSDASFGNVGVTFTKDEDTYSAKITAEVTAQVDAEDQLFLRAVAGDCVSEAISVGNGSCGYELTLTGLKSDGEMISLHLEGNQNASDVFLFEPLDGRGKSQTMLGFDSSSLPVHGQITIDPTDRVLNIYKTDGNGVPLKNIGFQIYSVGSLDAYLKGELSIGQTPTQEEIDTYGTGQPLATLVTDENGVASWNFGAVDGIYLVMELPNPVIEKPVDPFYVAVPGRNEDQTIYAVNVYPKNNVIPEELRIRKDVLQIDCDQGSVDVGKIHTWIIRSDIPAGLGQGQKYEISDELDHRLSYMGNVVVSLAEKDAAAGENLKVLQPEVDYTLLVSKTEETVDGELLDKDSLYVALTREGMVKAAAVTARDPEIRICFDTVINSRARVAEQIPNGATVEYVNNVGTRYRATSDEPWICTGGLKVRKTDASDITKNLAGATFKLARLATEAEVEVGLSESRYVDGQVTELVFLPFFDNESMEDDQVTEVTTGEDGIALFYGLAYGDYYLVETAAPAGYNLLREPVPVTIGTYSHLDDDLRTPETVEGTSVTVRNSAKFTMPTTGGMGTTIFTITGVALVSLALGMFAYPNRKRED